MSLECETCIGVWQEVVTSSIIKYSSRIFFLIQVFLLCYFTYLRACHPNPNGALQGRTWDLWTCQSCSYGYQRTDQNWPKCSGAHTWISDLFLQVLLPLKLKWMDGLWGDLAKETRMGLFPRAQGSCGLPVTQCSGPVFHFLKIYVFLGSAFSSAFPCNPKKNEVNIQRYSDKLNFVIFNCVLPKIWWIWKKYLSVFFHFLLDFF